jgi:thiol-disulfide isomerase/thioredoxin
MKHCLFLISFIAFSSLLFAQNNPDPKESAAIKQVALDYAEGFYSGDVTRMERAIHPDLNKAFPRYIMRTGRMVPSYSTYSQMIENTRAQVGILADSARHLQVQVLNIDGDITNVKILSANFNDYVQMVQIDGTWKIVNVLWNGGPAAVAARVPGFKLEEERNAVVQAAQMYVDGITGADAKRLETVLDRDANKLAIVAVAQTGKKAFQRQRFESLCENAFARIGKFDEVNRDTRISILDIMDGLAIVRLDLVNTCEYVHLYRNGQQWKVFNIIVAARPSLPLATLLPAIVDEPMPDFTLPIAGGGEFKLSEHRGKNILLMFPRGWLGRVWCPYCPYQYLELAELNKKLNLRKKYNLEIVFVLPYSSERINDWFEKFPDALRTVENIIDQQDSTNLPPVQREYAAWVSSHFPKKFVVKKNEVKSYLPVLVDEDRILSKQLKIFTNFWDGVTSDQNIASVFIVDTKGIVKMKCIGQMTEDRPSVDFLLDFISNMK